MAASSVTGTGPGSAEGWNKGNDRTTLGVEKLIGPRVILAGNVTLSGGTATVTFPKALDKAATEYVVMLTVVSASTTVARVTTKTNTSGVFTSFVITGNGTDVIDYVVISKG